VDEPTNVYITAVDLPNNQEEEEDEQEEGEEQQQDGNGELNIFEIYTQKEIEDFRTIFDIFD